VCSSDLVGSHTVEELARRGAVVVAVSDVHGGLTDDEGLDVDKLLASVRDGAPLASLPGTVVDNRAVLTSDCDVLVPCALGGVVTEELAGALRCRYVVEGANEPVVAAADRVLGERGIVVVPDILANAGGITVSDFEWVQNLQQFTWSLDEVQERLGTKMTTATRAVLDRAGTDGDTLRRAAYRIATERVREAYFLSGF